MVSMITTSLIWRQAQSSQEQRKRKRANKAPRKVSKLGSQRSKRRCRATSASKFNRTNQKTMWTCSLNRLIIVNLSLAPLARAPAVLSQQHRKERRVRVEMHRLLQLISRVNSQVALLASKNDPSSDCQSSIMQAFNQNFAWNLIWVLDERKRQVKESIITKKEGLNLQTVRAWCLYTLIKHKL